MATQARKVKGKPPRRYRVKLVKTVTFRLSSYIEVEMGPDAPANGFRNFTVKNAVEEAVAAEKAAGAERQWLTETSDLDSSFAIDWSSIQEIDPHIRDTSKTPADQT
jgi:hypothetical protein